MAITINGAGTITGISQGGLPDDVITASDIKDSDYQAPLVSGTDYLAPDGDGSSLTGLSSDWVKIATVDATAYPGATAVNFDSVFDDDTYNSYKLIGVNLTNGTAARELWCRWRASGSSLSSNSYYSLQRWHYFDGSTELNTTTNVWPGTYYRIMGDLSSGGEKSSTCELNIGTPDSSSRYPTISGTSYLWNGNNNWHKVANFGGTYLSSSQVIDGISIYPESDSHYGLWTLYGLKK